MNRQKICICSCKHNLIKPGRIRVTFGPDPHYFLGQWVIRVSDGDPVATLTQIVASVACRVSSQEFHS